MQETLNLVDRAGKRIGAMEKIAAHRAGELHEAFSIFIFNSRGEWLLQKRSRRKYHSAGLWSNACCGHPRAGELLESAAHRRLREEMGFDCSLREAFALTYCVELPGGMVEHEFDHVFVGRYERDPRSDRREASDWKWSTPSRIERDLAAAPDAYTYWFRLIFPRVAAHLAAQRKDLILRDYTPISEGIENLARLKDERIYSITEKPLRLTGQ
ncbi:MAG TPA: isopentenyl-diphosphate Delta-isomerase [Candidatus Paceibacterota bacterium]|nr:isopentenyl-diphosphate Delta-isomerase [Candidatus Paceibacterota bacterium]